MNKKEFTISDSIKEIAKTSTAIDVAKTDIPETMTFKVSEKAKEGFTLKRGELPLSDFAVNYESDDKDFNKQLTALKKAQAGILISKIDAGIALENICKGTTPLYLKGGYKSAEEFCTSIRMNKKTFSLWRCVARYCAPNGKKIPAITMGMLSESAIFAAYAKKIPIALLDAVAQTSDHAIISAKDLYSEYNRFISTIETDEPLPLKDENGNDITDSAGDSGVTVDTTADTLEIEGIKYHLFGVYGAGIKKGTTVKVPESANINNDELFKWAVENRLMLAKAAGIKTNAENNAKIVNTFISAESACCITLMQTIPEIKVISIASMKTLSGKGIREKENEPTTENENNGENA